VLLWYEVPRVDQYDYTPESRFLFVLVTEALKYKSINKTCNYPINRASYSRLSFSRASTVMRPSDRVLFDGVWTFGRQVVLGYRSYSFESTNPTLRSTNRFSGVKLAFDASFVFPTISGTKVKNIMSMKLYVGNLSFETNNQDLLELFAQSGSVQSANIVEDRETGRSRGFGFVEMASKEEGEAAIEALNGQEVNGRALKVNEAKPREDRGGGGGGRGGYGGGGGGRGGGGNRGGGGGGYGGGNRW
jgi:uncharacterized membrane protein YgcG